MAVVLFHHLYNFNYNDMHLKGGWRLLLEGSEEYNLAFEASLSELNFDDGVVKRRDILICGVISICGIELKRSVYFILSAKALVFLHLLVSFVFPFAESAG